MAKKNQGYVILDRNILQSAVWNVRPFSKGQAWVDLILLANHTDKPGFKGNKIVEYKRGMVNRSIASLSDRWGWNRKTVSAFLSALEADNALEIKRTTQGTTLTLVNYDFYQKKGQRSGQRKDSAADNEGTASGHKQIMIKNDKEGERNARARDPHNAMTSEEVIAMLTAEYGEDGQGGSHETKRI